MLTLIQDYHPDDIKGKGEPNFTLDRALKQHKDHGEHGGIEMKSQHRPRRSLDQYGATEMTGGREALGRIDERPGAGPRRTSSLGKQAGGFRKRFGSMGRKAVATEGEQ